MTKRMLPYLVVAAVAVGGWVIFARWSAARLAPPRDVRTLRDYLRWRPETTTVLVVSAGGHEHLCALGPSASLMSSGPSAYVFDDAGRIEDWSMDAGDDGAFCAKWNFHRPLQELTRVEALRRVAPPAPDLPPAAQAPPALPSLFVGPQPPGLRPIELRSSIYLARLDLHITVQPGGTIESVRTWGVGLPGSERVETRSGTLSASQQADLIKLFAGWDRLDPHYGGVADGPEITLRYGDKTVKGGSALPRQVFDVESALIKIADHFPPTTQPSS